MKRNLYLSNTNPDEALTRYLSALDGLLRPRIERVKVQEALDRVTSDAVFARVSSPLYNCAAMDGVAVSAKDTAAASEKTPIILNSNAFRTVDTGDPVRPPFDAVIMAEDLIETSNGSLSIIASAAPWQHVRPVGEDIVAGEMILPSRHRLRPIDIGVLLSGGILDVDVYARPKVAVIPTGTEMIEPGSEITDGSIIESNSHMFAGLISQLGGEPHRVGIVPDDRERISAAVTEAVRTHDMVIINAGSSAGTEDYTVHVLRELGSVVVHGVAIKPGKPVILAVVEGKPVIGLPGYPVSAYLTFECFAAPVLRRLTGRIGECNSPVNAIISRPLVSSLKHREYVRVKVGRVGDRLVASPLARGAGAAMSLVRSDGFCIIPQNSEGCNAGEEVCVELTQPLEQVERTLVSIGSHDLIMDVAADLMPVMHPGCHLSSAHVGSMGGLLALKRGEAHIAPTHLLDEDTGEYNIPTLRTLFAAEQIALIKGVCRIQGLIVQRGNPRGITGIGDLQRVSYINRQRGAGTRVLLDYLLKQAAIDPASIEGYEREAATHMAVAAAVSDGSADCGMGILSAAQALGLDFVEIGTEEYDFAVPVAFLGIEPVAAFLDVLRSEEFRTRVSALGGYTLTRCGEVVIL